MAAKTGSVKAQVSYGAELLLGASRQPQRDAALLLGRVLAKDRSWMLAHPEVLLTPAEIDAYHALLVRRTSHEPIQYILGEQEFYGLRFAVSPAVLIPRSETEHLVEAALDRLPAGQRVRVADIGTGSGAIAVAIAHARPLVHVTALDLSPSALLIARANAKAHGVDGRVRFLESDLLSAVAGERFEMILSNPPYVPATEDLEPQVALWEPHSALFAGVDGLAVYRRLLPAAVDRLVPGGLLALELGAGQSASLAALFRDDPRWDEPEFVNDLQGIKRVALAKRHETLLGVRSLR
jgi:release factor glutamine methyltransferase